LFIWYHEETRKKEEGRRKLRWLLLAGRPIERGFGGQKGRSENLENLIEFAKKDSHMLI
jgi:hypothetical protein